MHGRLAALLLSCVLLLGCSIAERSVSPGGSPAGGLGTAYRYNYYPDSAVYYDASRKLFFYNNGERWVQTTILPETVAVDWKLYVALTIDSDRPYTQHAAVVKKYPPGSLKKSDQQKSKKKS